jgi:anti-sigma-K factor RskA
VPASVTNVNQCVLELRLIAPGEQPRSLGLIEPGRVVHINLPADMVRRVSADATLAVSLEPPGGSPTGLPTGPVITVSSQTCDPGSGIHRSFSP